MRGETLPARSSVLDLPVRQSWRSAGPNHADLHIALLPPSSGLAVAFGVAGRQQCQVEKVPKGKGGDSYQRRSVSANRFRVNASAMLETNDDDSYHTSKIGTGV